jgi:hypothetical protein
LSVACMNLVLYGLTKAYYVWRNKSRDKKWNAMTTEQQLEYLVTTTDEGNKRVSDIYLSMCDEFGLTEVVGFSVCALRWWNFGSGHVLGTAA